MRQILNSPNALLVLILLLLCSEAAAQKSTVLIPRTDEAAVIDGQLDEPLWKGAAVFKNFVQINPGDNIEASKSTEVYLVTNKEHLFIAFKAYDDGDKIRATIPKRDFIFEDDNVGLLLDTFNDSRKAYALFFNPLGIQADGTYTEGKDHDLFKSIDFNVDLVMTSKGVLRQDGYTVEVAVPFKSMRYREGKGEKWGLHLFRYIKRLDNEHDSWMPVSRDRSSLLSQQGFITGIEETWKGHIVEIIPTLTISQESKQFRSTTTQDPTRFVNKPLEVEPGITTKLGITPNVILDFTYNPDFAQIEADQLVVTANQRFPIFYEEKRPFFLEGIDIFQTPLTAVHTRAIVDPDTAVKLTGKVGKTTFGFIGASDNAPGNFQGDERLLERNRAFLDRNAQIGVARVKRDIGQESSIGLVATSYNFVQKHNQLAGFDGRFRLSPTRVLGFQVLGSTSKRQFFDPEAGRNRYRVGNGFAYQYGLDQKGRNWMYSFTGEGKTRDYRADVGFTRRTNTNLMQQQVRYQSTPKVNSNLISWRLTNISQAYYDWQGRTQNLQNEINLRLNLRYQSYLLFGFNTAYERIFEEEFGPKRSATRAGAFAGDDSERQTRSKTSMVRFVTNPSKKYSASVLTYYSWNEMDYDLGNGLKFLRVSPAALIDQNAQLDPGPGNAFFSQANLTYQPTDSLRLSLDYTKSRLKRNDTDRVAFDDNIYSLRATYQLTPFSFFRARVDVDTLSSRVYSQLLAGWTPSPGTAFYAGYNDDFTHRGFSPLTGEFQDGLNRNGRTFFLKMSYLIRRSF
jgi:hypothetical protein